MASFRKDQATRRPIINSLEIRESNDDRIPTNAIGAVTTSSDADDLGNVQFCAFKGICQTFSKNKWFQPQNKSLT